MSQQKISHVDCRTTKKNKIKGYVIKIKMGVLEADFFFSMLCIYLMCMYEFMGISVHAVLLEAKRGHPKPSPETSYRRLWAALWVQKTELGSSETAASAPNHGTISPAPEKHTIWKEAAEKQIK